MTRREIISYWVSGFISGIVVLFYGVLMIVAKNSSKTE